MSALSSTGRGLPACTLWSPGTLPWSVYPTCQVMTFATCMLCTLCCGCCIAWTCSALALLSSLLCSFCACVYEWTALAGVQEQCLQVALKTGAKQVLTAGWYCLQATVEAMYLILQSVLYCCIVYFIAGFARDAGKCANPQHHAMLNPRHPPPPPCHPGGYP